ncbi:hypothetical protein [Biformimicrobium ophioploci]|uniref:hypothetical protein n=1 Tax=Biformimicrobium ophioploci TaxID=3036711 RepID=UPI0025545DFD|nr:hypothetical protein [Microbulbifer sp. NKW57]
MTKKLELLFFLVVSNLLFFCIGAFAHAYEFNFYVFWQSLSPYAAAPVFIGVVSYIVWLAKILHGKSSAFIR